MYLVVMLFTGIVLCLLLLDLARSEILNAVRAYIAGESRWSKGQRDAVYYLARYSTSHDERDYQAFKDAVAITLGDRQARLELEKSVPNLGLAYEGFVAGGNHRDDVKDMADFFRGFRNIDYIDKAIAIWAEGDRQISALLSLADGLHAAVTADTTVPRQIPNIQTELEQLNGRLSQLEIEFSNTLGEAARWVNTVTRQLVYFTVLLLLSLGAVFSNAVIKRITHMEKRLTHAAHFDPLTDLPNRLLFFDRMEQALSLARRNGAGFALLYIDLDGFKPINDTYGHEAGDQVLRAVALRLRNRVRRSDTVARLGGDEFVVLLHGISHLPSAEAVADKILADLALPVEISGGSPIQVGASVGVALYPLHGTDSESLLRTADSAMYETKRDQTLNRVSFER
jgi:diguanylate cyclase (GGDEF)-like protein